MQQQAHNEEGEFNWFIDKWSAKSAQGNKKYWLKVFDMHSKCLQAACN